MAWVALAGQDGVGASIVEVRQEVAVVERVLHHHLMGRLQQMVGGRVGTFLVVPVP